MSPIASRRPLKTILVVFAVAAAVALTALAAVGTPVLPCTSCHLMSAYVAGAKAGHSPIPCVACHASGVTGYIESRSDIAGRMIPSALSGTARLTGPAPVLSREVCLGCHDKVFEAKTESRGVAIVHAQCATGRSCASCHGGTGHPSAVRWARMYSMEECVACHQSKEAVVGCETCHVGRSTRQRLARGPWQVTHGPTWRRTHGLGSVKYCATCHPANYCVDCHGNPMPHAVDWGRTHGAAAKANRASCVTCHPAERLCSDCHGIEMPHPAGFLKKHSSVATSAKDSDCMTCHEPDDCIRCHVNHIHPGGPKKSWGTGGGAK